MKKFRSWEVKPLAQGQQASGRGGIPASQLQKQDSNSQPPGKDAQPRLKRQNPAGAATSLAKKVFGAL